MSPAYTFNSELPFWCFPKLFLVDTFDPDLQD